MSVVRVVLVLVTLTLGLGAAGWWWFSRDDADFTWRTSNVTRRDVRRVVSATGTLEADPTVQIGTQVSGIVSEILVDFNDTVKRGQVLARIDTALLDADVASASARLAEARAQRDRLQIELDRMRQLRAANAATDQELVAAVADVDVAGAQARSAQVSLDRARRNLGYATITAPVDGTVVNRAVDVGQTVNAGFSAPELFRIAGDLSRMLILVNVDESDIGLIREGQVAEFTVQAYADRSFRGTVRQVRLDATVEQSVVTYVVVVDTENPERLLFPGMTATVEFVVAEAADVLCVANAALRYRPETEAVVTASSSAGAASTGAPGASGAAAGRSGRGKSRGSDSKEGTLYTLDGALPTAEGGPLQGGVTRAIPVTVGLRGADCTEVSGEGIAEDQVVVLGVDREASSGSGSPLTQKSASTGRPGGF